MVDLLIPRLTPLPSRPRLEGKTVPDQVNFTLTICVPEPKSRIGLICANSPIDDVDPDGLAPIPITNADLNAEMDWMDSKINGENLEGLPVSQMTRAQYLDFMTTGVTTNVYGNPNGNAEADTEFHSSPYSYTINASEYPTINGMTLTGQELNYMGVGAGMAGAGYSLGFSELIVYKWWWDNHGHTIAPDAALDAMEAGWLNYNAQYGPGRFPFPPSACMDSMPAAFSETLSLTTGVNPPSGN